MCFLVMSLFSRDYIKKEIDSISNVLIYYSIQTAPGF